MWFIGINLKSGALQHPIHLDLGFLENSSISLGPLETSKADHCLVVSCLSLLGHLHHMLTVGCLNSNNLNISSQKILNWMTPSIDVDGFASFKSVSGDSCNEYYSQIPLKWRVNNFHEAKVLMIHR